MKKVYDLKNLGLFMVLVLLVTLIIQSGASLVYAHEKGFVSSENPISLLPSKVTALKNSDLTITLKEKEAALNEISKVDKDVKINFDKPLQSEVTLSNGKVIKTLKFELTGNNINSNSYYQIYFNKSGKKLGTQSIIAKNDANGKVTATMLENGIFSTRVTETNDGNIIEKYINNNWQADKETRGPAKDWVACFSDCLASAGLGSWLITLILAACTGACVATAGAGCIACALGVSAVAGGTAGSCSAKCS